MNPKPEKIQNTNPEHLVWNFLIFEHLDLFRNSDFEFRARPLTIGSLAPLRFRGDKKGVRNGLISQNPTHVYSLIRASAACGKQLQMP